MGVRIQRIGCIVMKHPLSISQPILIVLFVSLLAGLLQIIAGLLPGIGGMVGVLSTLPIALATRYSPWKGTISYILAAWLIYFVQPSLMPVFVLMNGPLGWFLGWNAYFQKGKLQQIFWATVVYFSGMLYVTFVAKIPILGRLVWGSTLTVIFSFFIFSLFTAVAWQFIMGKIFKF